MLEPPRTLSPALQLLSNSAPRPPRRHRRASVTLAAAARLSLRRRFPRPLVRPMPAQDQSSYISKEEIQQELKALEDSLSELERRGVELEQRLRGAEREGQDDVFDALMVDWFALISEKQSHVRKESELVYIAKTQDLEEQQPEVEVQLRRLMEKPSRLKTAADNKREEELMDKLLEIVNDRNAIIEGLDEDRLREKDEDEQLSQMMEQLGKKKIKKKQKSVVKKLFKRKQKKRAGKAC